ncbi:MAG TPA: hypothetical protein DDY49_00070 [Paenibacillaceae bacterium]|nr:hypothetical protein [Paenibacillaceae bacterium]
MILYHGTLDYAAVNIMARNHFIHSDGTHHLLGKGIYLYDDMDQAFALATKKTEMKNHENSPVLPYKPVVLKVEVEIDEESYMNLDALESQKLFFNTRNKFNRVLRDKGLICQTYTDSLFCDFLSKRLNLKMISKTTLDPNQSNHVPVQMMNQKDLDPILTMHFPTEKHYCLKDKTWIRNISYGRVGDL